MSEHTPGPWIALPPAIWEGSDGQWTIPRVALCGRGEHSEANAHLIAAAKDLLAELKHCVWLLDDLQGSETGLVTEQAKAAIAKAEGKQSN